MIRLQDLTPEIYYKQSRDFQFIGRLYDIVLNYIKTNATNLYNLPMGENMDEQLLNLLALTLGLKLDKEYNSKQLRAICSVLPTVLKHKGSLQALILATNALMAAEGITQPLDYSIEPKKGITLYVAQEIEDLTLLRDLLDYLLPAGLSCNIVKESRRVKPITTTFSIWDKVTVYEDVKELDVSKLPQLTQIDDKPTLQLPTANIKDELGALGNTTIVRLPKKVNTEITPEKLEGDEGEQNAE